MTVSLCSAGCLGGDDEDTLTREELAEFVTFEHWFERATVGIDLHVELQNQTDREFNILSVPEVETGEETVVSDGSNTTLTPGGQATIVVPILLDHDQVEAVTRYDLSLRVYEGDELLALYEEDWTDFQTRLAE